jgi:hypothetical protein
MSEREITRIAVTIILGDFIGNQSAIWPTSEVADMEGLRPDCLLVALDESLRVDELDQIDSNDLVLHAIESKAARHYMVGPEFSGVIQASDYFANYNWLAVPENADLNSLEWRELIRACRRERIGLVICGRKTGQIVLNPGYDDTECCTSYPCWPEIFGTFCSRYGCRAS